MNDNIKSFYLLEPVNNLQSIKDTSIWATDYRGKKVTASNISYLITYGKIHRTEIDGKIFVDINELKNYYDHFHTSKEEAWKNKLGDDLNWALSFDEYKEAETTKHVHRLHPYKGKFIPQLVEYFLDSKTDKFKQQVYFQPGDIVYDPFCGSGTTLVQSNELGINAIGNDVSEFNALISNVKIGNYDLLNIEVESKLINDALINLYNKNNLAEFELELAAELAPFNKEFFPSPNFKFRLKDKDFDEEKYGSEKQELFLKNYKQLVKKYNVNTTPVKDGSFLGKWYLPSIRNEIELARKLISEIKNDDTRKIATIILSRTIRSCRATTHSDLATLKEPVTETYYCHKHGRICKPLYTIISWWDRYSKDTIKRLQTFNTLKTNTFQFCLTGDSRNINLIDALKNKSPGLADKLRNQKIKGIFSSPPYVGLIDYHEQHAYAYDLFGFERKDEMEIGKMKSGASKKAQEEYVAGISDVLLNSRKYLSDDYDVFLVANDKFNLYPIIANRAGMQIVNQFKRPVLNRTERDKAAYSETIFHFKDNNNG